MDDSVFEENLSFKIIQLPFSSELELGSYIVFIAKTASQKNYLSMKFVSPEVALYLPDGLT